MNRRLKKARVASGFKSARQAAQRFGWKESTYAAHENGQNQFDADTAALYGKAFKVTASWLLTGQGPGLADIPEAFDSSSKSESSIDSELGFERPENTIYELDVRLGAGGGGMPIDLWRVTADGDTFAAEGIRDEWTLPSSITSGAMRSSPKYLRIFEVIGNSMEPRLFEGDRVFVDTRFTFPTPEGIFALYDGTGLIIKQLQLIRGSVPVQVRIISSNDAYPPQAALLAEIRIIGRYVGRFTVM